MKDLWTPIHFINDQTRDEILIVFFDGFIKNTSEGIVRTMFRDEEDWLEKYPDLDSFDEDTKDELYQHTMLFQPKTLLKVLSGNALSDEEIEKDLKELRQEMIIDNSKITSFEFGLFQLLHEKFIKKCYIYKEEPFEKNEIFYLENQYEEVLDKMEFVHGDFLSLFEDVKPTTIFLHDISMVELIRQKYDEDTLMGTLFVVLNSFLNVNINDDESITITKEFIDKVNEINTDEAISVTSMFNLPVDEMISEPEDQEEEDE